MHRIGRYELTRVLGRGGMGTVYEATLLGPGGYRKPVAVKVLADGVDALHREARIGGLLRHRNLVDVYEVGDDDGRMYAAMELCRGGCLYDHLPLPPRAVVEVGLAVCAALEYAHADLGLVHLDIKPDNLLLAEDGTVKVADLGIAHADGFHTDGRVRGTRGYMAPEHRRGEPVDARADIYALGVTLVELATGARPGASDTMDWSLDSEETMELEAAESQEAPDGVPDWLAPAVVPCLEPFADHRWPSMAALADALRALECEGPGLRAALDLQSPPTAPRQDTTLGDEPDPFVGRAEELARLAVLLADPGLVVLKGPAGIGKSRLAAAAARRWQTRTEGRAWRCDLTEARTLDDLLASVASALDVPLAGRSSPANAAQLGHAIAGRGALVLVLDGFEQIVDLASVISTWIDRAPDARFVITTRVALPTAETVIEVGPLAADAARELLVARARHRAVDVAQDPRLGELADRLDGLPLALELAAGRLGVLSVPDVLERLGLSLLRKGTGDRHDTLRGALDASWELLSPQEQAALAQLSTFSGGFGLEAAEAVLRTGEQWPVELVQALLDQSLVYRVGPGRFDLLRSIHEYATEKLANREELASTQARHGAWYAGLRDRLGSAGSTARARSLATERDNLVAACRRATATRDPTVAIDTLEAAWEVFSIAGPFSAALDLAAEVEAVAETSGERARAHLCHGAALRGSARVDEARRQFEAAVDAARSAGDAHVEGQALARLGALDHTQGRMEQARRHYDEALAVHRRVGDRAGECATLANVAVFHMHARRSSEQALATLTEVVANAREVGDRRTEGLALGNLATLLAELGRNDEARGHFEAALAINRELGARRSVGHVLSNLATMLRRQGETDEARSRFIEALAVHREVGIRRSEAIALSNLANTLLDLGDVETAEASYLDALAVHREVGNRRSEAIVLGNLGRLNFDRGDTSQARENYGGAIEVAREIGDRRFEAWTLGLLARLEAGEGDLQHAFAHIQLADSILRGESGIGDPAAIAVFLACSAEIHWAAGQLDAARSALDEAKSIAPPGNIDVGAYIEEAEAVLASP